MKSNELYKVVLIFHILQILNERKWRVAFVCVDPLNGHFGCQTNTTQPIKHECIEEQKDIPVLLYKHGVNKRTLLIRVIQQKSLRQED